MIGRIKGYLTGVKKEMGKVSWLTQQEARGSTIVVVCFCFIMAMIIFVIDRSIFVVSQLFN